MPARRSLVAVVWVFSRTANQGSGKAVGGSPAGRTCGAEQRRIGVGARTRALRKLTREHCLSETSAASEASCERDPRPSSARESAPQAPTAAYKPCRAPARGLARHHRRMSGVRPPPRGPALPPPVQIARPATEDVPASQTTQVIVEQGLFVVDCRSLVLPGPDDRAPCPPRPASFTMSFGC